MAYFPYIVLFHNISSFILSLLLLSISVKVLYKKISVKITTISVLITVYFIYVFIAGIVLFLHSIYSLAFWRPEENLYNAQILYILGVAWNCILFSSSIFEIFLCFDRICLILFPIKYEYKIKMPLVILTLLTLIIALALWCWGIEFIQMFPTFTKTICLTFGCLVPVTFGTSYFLVKLIFIVANLIACGILFALFKSYTRNNFNTKSKNFTKTLIIVSVITILADLIPNILTGIGTWVFQIFLSSYVGPYNTTLYGISIAFCSKMYSKVILKNDVRCSTQGVTFAVPSRFNKTTTITN